MKQTVVQTELLIVGAGPAGGALACFLASHGTCSVCVANLLMILKLIFES